MPESYRGFERGSSNGGGGCDFGVLLCVVVDGFVRTKPGEMMCPLLVGEAKIL